MSTFHLMEFQILYSMDIFCT